MHNFTIKLCFSYDNLRILSSILLKAHYQGLIHPTSKWWSVSLGWGEILQCTTIPLGGLKGEKKESHIIYDVSNCKSLTYNKLEFLEKDSVIINNDITFIIIIYFSSLGGILTKL